MAIITKDILLSGIRRDDVFEWLSEPKNHDLLVQDAFDSVTGSGGSYEMTLSTPGRKRTMGYRFKARDDQHGGRRILIDTSGKRTKGHLNYSLRTMRPSVNTMVTIRMDYNPGGALGGLVNSTGLADALDSGLGRILENLSKVIPRDL